MNHTQAIQDNAHDVFTDFSERLSMAGLMDGYREDLADFLYRFLLVSFGKENAADVVLMLFDKAIGDDDYEAIIKTTIKRYAEKDGGIELIGEEDVTSQETYCGRVWMDFDNGAVLITPA
ncbi:hypothetical protein U5801_11835 [Lamprobacter modestohalophilus]|uniref:hypothetical protein n=1 Tax=Lamprobacter modestohalophilus TaxID=1064514 RepID=UPI002ADEADF1|nr:hypothetical protein [Lamprobacter modestohalophilus]MEA1050495.1 hypothetical protein [Lamprobacter modestohalophilus]